MPRKKRGGRPGSKFVLDIPFHRTGNALCREDAGAGSIILHGFYNTNSGKHKSDPNLVDILEI